MPLQAGARTSAAVLHTGSRMSRFASLRADRAEPAAAARSAGA
ncbi:hypothetical protein ACWC9T_30620 [Kitasatospora sp. NPDC001159]